MTRLFRCAAAAWFVPVALAALAPSSAAAQRVTSVTPAPIALAAPTATDFAAGFTQPVTHTVATAAAGRRHNLVVRLSHPYANPLVGTVQASADGGTTWLTLTTSDVVLRACMQGSSSYAILLRKSLSYTQDPPGARKSSVTYNAIAVTC